MKTSEALFPAHLFRYDPDSGVVFGPNGKVAGTAPDSTCQYRRVTRGGIRVMEHRLAWRLANGEWPAEEIDHRNGIKTDNRLSNLRLASPSQNKCNMESRGRHRGAYLDSVNSRYIVAVQVGRSRKVWTASHLFSAVVAARLIRRVLHREFAYEMRGNVQGAA